MDTQLKATPVHNILVVDDIQENLKLMIGILKGIGYKVRPVTSGPLALEAARKVHPDLILLDINMPDMNGYQVCKQLKADPELADIPVIFLSALNEMEDKVRAFRVGGADYITKPFQFEEVAARVECQLNLRQLRANLEQRNVELAQSNELLREAEKMRDNLLHMVVHDMRSPLTVQLGFVELLLNNATPPLNVEERSWAAIIHETTLKLNNMVDSLLDINRMEAGKMPINRCPVDLCKIVQDAIGFYGPMLGGRTLSLESSNPAVIADCDEILVQRVIENLIGNAIKFTADTGSVRVSVTQNDAETRVAVTDDGTGVAQEHHDTIFMKFGQIGTHKRKHSTGIGLAFCKLAIETQGGHIGIVSEVGKGSSFWFALPQKPAPVEP